MLKGENFVRPDDVVRSIISLLKHDTQIKELLLEKDFSMSLKEVTSIIGSLDKFPYPIIYNAIRYVISLCECETNGISSFVLPFLINRNLF